MTFQELKDHIEEYGCTLDHFEDDCYYATNCINFEMCLIEEQTAYSTATLCHYFYELKVPAPAHLREQMDSYRELREAMNEIEKPGEF